MPTVSAWVQFYPIQAGERGDTMAAMILFKPYAVRYQVSDVARSVEFYSQRFGFTRVGPHRPAFAMVSNGDLLVLLSGPGSSGARAMPDGRRQESGGWNRIVLA